MGRLNPEAIARVQQEAWPQPLNADELHDALNILGFINETEIDSRQLKNWQRYLSELQLGGRATRLERPDGCALWVAAERLQAMLLVCPGSNMSPPIKALQSSEADSFEQAMTEITRSRLEGLGPVTVGKLAEAVGRPETELQQALLELEQEGFVIQGHFTEPQHQTEWCERGLLARIHRYTLKQLRSEVEPVSPATFMQYLFQWQGLVEPAEGAAALERVMLQLEGVSLPAGSWESDILPVRLQPYFSSQLDELSGSGKLAWLRMSTASEKDKKRKNPAIKTTPIAFVYRPHMTYWCQSDNPEPEGLSSAALKVLNVLRQWGASFFEELLQQTGLLKSQLENALGELVAWGLVNSDQFQGLRALITPAKKQNRSRHRPILQTPLSGGGRWSLIRPSVQTDDSRQKVEHIARTLLTRYGVVFRKLLERESGLPSWRDLLYVYRRLEARGELRGGRFVQGFAGEQFALPEAVSLIRKTRKQSNSDEMVAISSADPLNLTGIITPGKRIPAQTSHRILYLNGKPVATSQNGDIKIHDQIAAADHWQIKNLLTRKYHPAAFHKPHPGPLI
jgi:ATP-dependent Lhr-like helicase